MDFNLFVLSTEIVDIILKFSFKIKCDMFNHIKENM